MTHPACDFAKHMMQVAFAGTGIWISDGATNILPRRLIAWKRASGSRAPNAAENRDAVPSRLAAPLRAYQHSLVSAYYQGWIYIRRSFPRAMPPCIRFSSRGSIPPPRA